ncbi:MAG: hypothetical protein L3K13_01285 [Thermoplasmata archaeon]|nr:hypothetical protein [Thermoplasmata archaeon]
MCVTQPTSFGPEQLLIGQHLRDLRPNTGLEHYLRDEYPSVAPDWVLRLGLLRKRSRSTSRARLRSVWNTLFRRRIPAHTAIA